MSKATKVALIALSVGLVAGCGRGGNTMAANKAAAPVNASNSAVPANAASPASGSAVRGNEGVHLAGGGIAPSGGAAENFGAPKAAVLERVTAILGPPDERLPQTDDCGPGVREMVGWRGGLTLFFSDTAFIGWSASMPANGGAPVRFAGGLGPGSTRADLQSVDNQALIRQATDLQLAFDSEQADARIREMWSGRTCAQEPGEQIRPN